MSLLVTVPLVAGQVFNMIRDVTKVLRTAQGNTSLTEVTKAARVEPIVIIGQDCVNLEYSTDILNSLLSVFCGYYLQAVALTTNISGIRVGKVLDKLNPNTDPNRHFSFETYSQASGTEEVKMNKDWKVVAESYKYRLPTTTGSKHALAYESSVLANGSGDLAEAIQDNVNLSVGKIIEVTITENEQKATLPISFRLMVNQVSEKSLVSMLTLRSMDHTFTERYHAWRAGRISFIKDLILCQDMIDAHKKAMINDKSGILTDIVDRSNNSKTNSIFTSQVNLASASNIYVISEQTASELETKLGGKLSNTRIRDALFESGYMMILVVVDRAWERVTFYHRGIAAGTNLGIKDLKNANKGSGPDISALLKAYQMGNNPSF